MQCSCTVPLFWYNELWMCSSTAEKQRDICLSSFLVSKGSRLSLLAEKSAIWLSLQVKIQDKPKWLQHFKSIKRPASLKIGIRLEPTSVYLNEWRKIKTVLCNADWNTWHMAASSYRTAYRVLETKERFTMQRGWKRVEFQNISSMTPDCEWEFGSTCRNRKPELISRRCWLCFPSVCVHLETYFLGKSGMLQS